MQNKYISEDILNTWIRFEGIMRMTMMSGELTHREFGICNMLANSKEPVTATMLCEKLEMHKSQMNRTILNLESRGIVTRERAGDDRRKVYIKLNRKNCSAYNDMHEKALKYTDEVVSRLGEQRITQIKQAFTEVVDALINVTKPGNED